MEPLTDYSGIALVVGAVLTPVSVIAVGWFTSRRVSAVGDTAMETLRQTAQVNHAVNGRGPRETTLEQDMTTVMAKQEEDAPSLVKGRGLVQIVEELLVELKKTNGSQVDEQGR